MEFLSKRGISQRRDCSMVGIGSSSQRYQAHPREEYQLAERLRSLARRYQRYVYRRVWAELGRDGFKVNLKRVYRVWQAEGLSLPRRKRRSRGGGGERDVALGVTAYQIASSVRSAVIATSRSGYTVMDVARPMRSVVSQAAAQAEEMRLRAAAVARHTVCGAMNEADNTGLEVGELK